MANLFAWPLLVASLRRSYFAEYWHGTTPYRWRDSAYAYFDSTMQSLKNHTHLVADPDVSAFAMGRDPGGPLQLFLVMPAVAGLGIVVSLSKFQRSPLGRGALLLYCVGITAGAYTALDRGWTPGWSETAIRVIVGMVVAAAAATGLRLLIQRLRRVERQVWLHGVRDLVRLTLPITLIGFVLGGSWLYLADYRELRRDIRGHLYRATAWICIHRPDVWDGRLPFEWRPSLIGAFTADIGHWYRFESDTEVGWLGFEAKPPQSTAQDPTSPSFVGVWIVTKPDGTIVSESVGVPGHQNPAYLHGSAGYIGSMVLYLVDIAPPPRIANDRVLLTTAAYGLRPPFTHRRREELPAHIAELLANRDYSARRAGFVYPEPPAE